MNKTISPSGWDFDGPIVLPLKIHSGGLTGHDRRQFTKRASGSENVFLPYLDSVKFAEDEEPVHMLALGAREAYGANRNGDAFREAVLKRAHDTFVKYAKPYRNHRNRPQEGHPWFGTIKLSAYNPTMRRVELLVGLNKTKSAADRNGGQIADRELEKLARGEDIPVSMSCRVTHDVCSYCHNKARTREEYCKAAACQAGGCADNLSKLVKIGSDVHHLYVDNPDPVFFDISSVFKPADRVAYSGRADYLHKAASDGGFVCVGGAKAAEDLGIQAPLAVVLAQDIITPDAWTTAVTAQVKLAKAMALAERQKDAALSNEFGRAFMSNVQPEMNLEELGLAGNPEKIATALGALADRKVILPLRDFARMTKRAELADAAGPRLIDVYLRMAQDGSLDKRIAANPYAPSEKEAADRMRTAVVKWASLYSLEKSAVEQRCQLSAIRGYAAPTTKQADDAVKTAADSGPAEELARDYAIYKLAALYRISEFDTVFPLTVGLALTQNHVV